MNWFGPDSATCGCCNGCDVCESVFSLDWRVRLCNFNAEDLTGDGMTSGSLTTNQSIADSVTAAVNGLALKFEVSGLFASGSYTSGLDTINWRVRRSILGFTGGNLNAKRDADGTYTDYVVSSFQFFLGVAWTSATPCDFAVYWALTMQTNAQYLVYSGQATGLNTGGAVTYTSGSPESQDMDLTETQISCTAPTDLARNGMMRQTLNGDFFGSPDDFTNPFSTGASIKVSAATPAPTVGACPPAPT